MDRLRLLVVLLILLVSARLTAQQPLNNEKTLRTITLKLTGQKGEPVPFATVALFSGHKTTPLYVRSTDSTGICQLTLHPDSPYTVRTRHLMYRDTLVYFDGGKAPAGPQWVFYLQDASGTSLKGVTVNGKPPLIERKLDRVVYNIENSVNAIGTDALEALHQLPGVVVMNDQLAITGKGSVNVLLNGRLLQLSGQDLANMLRSIPADQLTKIELITNPPAQYDAAGNAGLINIVTKKRTTNGFDGNVSAGYRQTTYGTGNAGGNFSYATPRLNSRVSFNYSNGSVARQDQYDINYPDLLWKSGNNIKTNQSRIFGEAGLDYNITNNTLIGATYRLSNNDIIMNQLMGNSFSAKNGTEDSLINTLSRNQQQPHTNTLNLHMESRLDTSGKKLSIDADYLAYSKTQLQDLSVGTWIPGNPASPVNNYSLQITSPQDIKVYTVQADLQIPLRVVNLAFGGKLSFINNNSATNFYWMEHAIPRQDSSQSNAFQYKENTQALYADASGKLGKWELKAGLRAEFTQTDGLSVFNLSRNKQQYLQLFPTFYALRKLNKGNSITFSYGRRINRPSYWQLNPFRWYSNLYSYSEGNPFLQPSYNHNFEVSFTRKDWLVTSVYANITENGFSGLSLPDSISLKVATVQRNFLSSSTVGLSQMINITGIPWLENSNQLSIYYSQSISHDAAVANTSGWGANISTDNSFILNTSRTLIAVLSFSYQFPQMQGYMYSNSYYNVNTGIKALLYNKKLTVALNASDIFRTFTPGFNSTVNGVAQHFSSYDDYRNVRINLSYKFGNNKSKKRNTNNSNKSEEQRIN